VSSPRYDNGDDNDDDDNNNNNNNNNNNKQDKQCTYNVILRHVRVTTVAVEKP
jgi:hypothetical protein